MEYLAAMTTHVPGGTPAGAVEDVRARAAAARAIASTGRRG
jgi:muconolactone delta-isomerase